jgi:hypothetical protein
MSKTDEKATLTKGSGYIPRSIIKLVWLAMGSGPQSTRQDGSNR